MTNSRFCLQYKLIQVLVLIVAVISVISTGAAVNAATDDQITIVIDGRPVSSDVAPMIVEGRTLVPLRVISENLGAGVTWEDATKTVTVVTGGHTIVLQINNQRASVKGEEVTLDVAPRIVRGRTLVPLRFIGESLGAQVHWDQERRQVIVRQPYSALTGIFASSTDGAGRITLQLSAPAQYRVAFLDKDGDKPYRMLIDLPKTRTLLAGEQPQLAAGPVTGGRISALPGDEEGIRLVLDMNEPLPLRARQAENGRDIVIELPLQVTGLRFAHTETGQAVFIDGSGPIKAKSFTLSDPDRIVIDIEGMVASASLPATFEVGGGLVPRIRTSQFDTNTVRVVIDLHRPVAHKLVSEGNRAVVYLDQSGSRPPLSSPGEGTAMPVDSAVLAGRRIVIDAGHGGKDPGSTGVSGIHEKVLTLETAVVLQKMLAEAGAQVIMTRTGDYYVDLYERANIANAAGAHAFVSIHMNSYYNQNLAGTETYHHPSAAEGKRLARLVHEEMLKSLGRPDRGVRSADFVVLRETTMPAVLVEAGYLSNPTEEKILLDPAGRLKIAEAIYRALVRFFSS